MLLGMKWIKVITRFGKIEGWYLSFIFLYCSMKHYKKSSTFQKFPPTKPFAKRLLDNLLIFFCQACLSEVSSTTLLKETFKKTKSINYSFTNFFYKLMLILHLFLKFKHIFHEFFWKFLTFFLAYSLKDFLRKLQNIFFSKIFLNISRTSLIVCENYYIWKFLTFIILYYTSKFAKSMLRLI